LLNEVLNPTRTKRSVRRAPAAERRHRPEQLVASRERIADAVPVRRQDLSESAGFEEVSDINPRRLSWRGPNHGVRAEVTKDQVGVAVVIQVRRLNRGPPAVRM